MNPTTECLSLAEVRTHIDRLDGELLALIAERGAYVRQAARFKRNAEEVAAPQRVAQILARIVVQADQHGLDRRVAEATWRAMITAFIAVEHAEYAAVQPPSP